MNERAIGCLQGLLFVEHDHYEKIKKAIEAAFPVGSRVAFTKGKNRLEGEITQHGLFGRELHVQTATGAVHKVSIGYYAPLPEILSLPEREDDSR